MKKTILTVFITFVITFLLAVLFYHYSTKGDCVKVDNAYVCKTGLAKNGNVYHKKENGVLKIEIEDAK